jgi:hypothetical protein
MNLVPILIHNSHIQALIKELQRKIAAVENKFSMLYYMLQLEII